MFSNMAIGLINSASKLNNVGAIVKMSEPRQNDASRHLNTNPRGEYTRGMANTKQIMLEIR